MTVSEFINKVGFKVDKQSVTEVNNTINSIKSTATKVLGTIGIGLSLSSMNTLIEEFSQINLQIASATSGLEDVEEVQEKILEAANETRTAYATTANTISDLASNASGLFDVDSAIDYNNAVTKLLKTAGRSDSEISSVMTSLESSFTAGSVSSSTITTLLNTAPEAAQMLAEYLGVATSDLTTMATEGTISLNALQDAFVANADTIDAAFADTKYSITDALTTIRNKWGYWLTDLDDTLDLTNTIGTTMVKVFDKAMSVLSKVKNAVVWLTDTLGGTENTLKLIAAVAAGLFVAFNFDKITSALSGATVKFLAMFAVILLVVLLIEDFIGFMQGKNSLIGTLLEEAGIDSESIREKIQDAWEKIKTFLFNTWEKIKSTASAVWNKLKEFWEEHGASIFETLSNAWQKIKTALLTAWNKIYSTAISVWNKLKAFWEEHGESIKTTLSTAWNKIKTTLIKTWNKIKSTAETVWNDLGQLWDDNAGDVKETLIGAWDEVSGSLQETWETLKSVASETFDSIKTTLDEHGITVDTVLTAAWQGAQTAVSTACSVLCAVISGLASAFAAVSNAVNTVIQFFQEHKDAADLLAIAIGTVTAVLLGFKAASIIQTAIMAAMTAATTAYSVATGIAEAACTGLATAVTFLTSPIGIAIAAIAALVAIGVLLYNHWDEVKEFCSTVWNGIKETVSGVVDSIGEFVGGVVETVQEGFQDAIDWITGLPAEAIQWGADIIQGIIDGITGAISGIGEAVSNIAGTVKSFLGFSEPEEGPLSDFSTYMPDMMDLMAEGITGNESTVTNALQSVLERMAQLMKKYINNAKSWGVDLMKNLVDGINSMMGSLQSSISEVAELIDAYVGFSEPEKGPLSDFHTFMPDMIDLMAEGISSNMDRLVPALEDMAALTKANVASPATVTTATTNSQVSKSVIQNVTISNEFNGDLAGQQKSSAAMSSASKDATAELARALSYAW